MIQFDASYIFQMGGVVKNHQLVMHSTEKPWCYDHSVWRKHQVSRLVQMGGEKPPTRPDCFPFRMDFEGGI